MIRAYPKTGCDIARLISHLDSLNMPLRQNGEKQSMLVSVVETVYRPNGVVPSLARPYLVSHEIEEIRTGNIYVSLFQRTLYFFNSLMDGEFGSIIDICGHQALNCL